MEEQVAKAIEVAWSVSADENLKHEAIEYLNQVRGDPSAWPFCVTIFVKEPRYSEVVRHFVLEIINNAIQSGSATSSDLPFLVESLMQYVRRSYGPDTTQERIDSTVIQNKIAQVVTYLFCALYGSGWESFFDDFLALTTKTSSSGLRDNAYGVMLYLRVLLNIHEEIGDMTPSRSAEEQDKANQLKNLMRRRDVAKIVSSWQDILSQYHNSNDLIIEFTLRCVGDYVSWIDIALVVNQNMLDLLFQQLAKAQETNLKPSQEKVRDSAIDVFTEIVAKKMKGSDKVQLISFLSLQNVVSQLAASAPLQETRFTSLYDTDLAESVAKLVSVIASDIVKVLETESDLQVKRQAEAHLQAFLPLILRFFSDQYDEICSTVLPSVGDLISFLRKTVRTSGPLPPQYSAMLVPVLKAIVEKLKYDETSEGGEDEETDEAEFQELRKRLASLQQSIAEVDEELYINVVVEVVGATFEQLQQVGTEMNWRNLDLALYEMFLLGDLAIKQGGLYRKDKPNPPAAERLVEMMSRLVVTDMRLLSHPATQLQYMEICVKYCAFFEKHSEHIPRTLEHFLQLAHHPSMRVKARTWYLFQRFVRHLRSQVGSMAQNIIEAVSDLLTIQAEVPQEASSDGDEMSSEDHNQTADFMFNSQLYLFEAIGCASGTSSVPVEKQVLFAQTITQPLFTDIQQNLNSAKEGDEKAILQIHHDIMALGTLARGYSDWVPGSASTSTSAPPAEVSEVFSRVAEATLVSLSSLKTSFNIRTAARFAFSRLVGILGARILPLLPRWIDGLLGQASSKDEMALFLRLLDQVIFGFKTEIRDILDSLLTPFLQRVFQGMSQPMSGTDDEIQLAELKREYLSFLLAVLGHDLASVLVTGRNQAVFQTVISTLEHFAQDPNDFPTAKMAFQVLTRMVNVWGGPDVVAPPHEAQANGIHPEPQPQPVLPGFDNFIKHRFSCLVWAIPRNPSFNAKEAKQLLGDMATLHKAIYVKLGSSYLVWLRENELKGVRMDEKAVMEYVDHLAKDDLKTFRVFFQSLFTK